MNWDADLCNCGCVTDDLEVERREMSSVVNTGGLCHHKESVHRPATLLLLCPSCRLSSSAASTGPLRIHRGCRGARPVSDGGAAPARTREEKSQMLAEKVEGKEDKK